MKRLYQQTWRVIARAFVILQAILLITIGLQFFPGVRKAEAQLCAFNTSGTSLSAVTSALCQAQAFIFLSGAQIGGNGVPLSGVYSIVFPITATQIAQDASQTVTATVPGLITGTGATGVCAMTTMPTGTSGQPTGVFVSNVDFITGTSTLTSTGAPILVQVRLTNVAASQASISGNMRCDVFAH